MNLCFLGDVRSNHVQKFIHWFAPDNTTHLISFDYQGDPRATAGLGFFRGINTRVHLIRSGLLPFSPYFVNKIIQRITPDLVQCHFITHYGFLGAYSNIHPLVMSAMGDDILIHPGKTGYGLAVKFALGNADMVICDGINSMDTLERMGVPEQKRALIYPGIDMRKFHPDKRVPQPNQTVFCPRGFEKIYDPDSVFEIINTVHHALPEVQFNLLGHGTELGRFKELARSRGMEEVVNYLGYIDGDILPQYLASSDVNLTCALSDGGIPVSTVEAMACGVPVVSSDAGDARLWVQQGVTGYVVRKSLANPYLYPMAEHIIDLLTDDTKRERFGKAARDFVEREYDYPTEMRKVETLYHALTAEAGGL